jgi:hypothetical protein
LLATQFQPNHVSFGFIDAWEFQWKDLNN